MGDPRSTPPADLIAFCEEVHARLVGALGLFCGDRQIAEDLAQDAIVQLCRKWDEVRDLDRPDRWLFTVAFNLARSHHRRRGVARAAYRLLGGGWFVESRPTDSLDDGIDLRQALDRLHPTDRQIVVMRHHLGFDATEIAAELGMAPGTVRSRLSRATARLRPRLNADVTEGLPR